MIRVRATTEQKCTRLASGFRSNGDETENKNCIGSRILGRSPDSAGRSGDERSHRLYDAGLPCGSHDVHSPEAEAKGPEARIRKGLRRADGKDPQRLFGEEYQDHYKRRWSKPHRMQRSNSGSSKETRNTIAEDRRSRGGRHS